MRILFICLGNTCRSPAAERVVDALARRAGLRLETDSAAVSDIRAGAAPTPVMQDLAAARGYDLSGGRARLMTAADFTRNDMIFAMDNGILTRAGALRPAGNQTPLRLFGSLVPETEDPEIADPWDTGDYPAALTRIEAAAQALVEKISKGQLRQ